MKWHWISQEPWAKWICLRHSDSRLKFWTLFEALDDHGDKLTGYPNQFYVGFAQLFQSCSYREHFTLACMEMTLEGESLDRNHWWLFKEIYQLPFKFEIIWTYWNTELYFIILGQTLGSHTAITIHYVRLFTSILHMRSIKNKNKLNE